MPAKNVQPSWKCVTNNINLVNIPFNDKLDRVGPDDNRPSTE